MAKYEVTLYFHTSIVVEVEADSEERAIEEAYFEAGKKEYDEQFLNNAQEDGAPDVEEL
jgi:hypothetical protein